MWRNQAACNSPDVDPAWFDAVGSGARPVEALRVCRNCPVRQNCLDEALARPSTDDLGVWGGTTVRNRKEIRAKRMSRDRAMRLADRTADEKTWLEQVEEREPWLAGDLSVIGPGDVEDPVGVCVDCADESWLGGLRCKRCYLAQAQPQTSTGHGTAAGYAAHRRRGEEPCSACRQGHAQAQSRRGAA